MDDNLRSGRRVVLVPQMTRRTNEAGVALIKAFEGLRLKAYKCPAGFWTIGYGNRRSAREGMEISEAEAERILLEDLNAFEHAVCRVVKVPLNDNEFAALVSFAFNVGISNFEKSTLVTLLNCGWYEQVPAQLMRWRKCNGEPLGGLSRRRAAEGALWKRG